MKRTTFAVILVLLAVASRCAETQVLLTASPQSARIGDRIDIHLIVKTSPEIDDIIVNGETPDVDVIGRKSLPVRDLQDYRLFERIITIAVFKIGEFTVGPFEVAPVKDKTPGETVKSGTLSIKINSVLEEGDKDIKPLKKPMELRGRPWHLLKYLLIPLILLQAVWLAVLLLKKRKKTFASRAGPLPAPEEELASSIRELAVMKLLEKGEAKKLFIRLTDILKRFFDRYYGFNAEDMTTRETLLRLRREEREEEVSGSLGRILDTSDLAKFARFVPESKTVDDLFGAIERLIVLYRKRRADAQTEPHAAAK